MLGFRLSGADRRQDGTFNNAIAGFVDSNNRHRFIVRGQLLWELGARFSVRVIADYSKSRERCCASVVMNDPVGAAGLYAITLPGVVGAGGVVAAGPAALASRTFNGPPPLDGIEQYGASAEVNWNLGAANLVYIGAYRHSRAEATTETDGSAAQVDEARSRRSTGARPPSGGMSVQNGSMTCVTRACDVSSSISRIAP